VSKTPAKSVTPAKTAAKKATAKASAPAPAAPARKIAAKPAPAKPGVKAESKAAPAKSAPANPAAKAPTKPAASSPQPQAAERELATAVATETQGREAPASTASRFADRFSPAKPASRMFVDSSMDTQKPAAKVDPKLANAWKHKSGRDLTEEELLAMPESEYMNEKQLDFFRARLQALKDDLLSNAGETTEHLREDTSIVPDPADRATIEEEHALELRTRDRERKLLKKIAQSLARIDAGDYGFCDETGEPIGLGRLIARPTATLSLEAQQRRELKQKMFGD
jgi:DnaK suppressor protein